MLVDVPKPLQNIAKRALFRNDFFLERGIEPFGGKISRSDEKNVVCGTILLATSLRYGMMTASEQNASSENAKFPKSMGRVVSDRKGHHAFSFFKISGFCFPDEEEIWA